MASSAPVQPLLFATTRWSVVLAARDDESEEATTALETLCRAYWPPLYAFARRRGHSPHDAEDLTQGFFARLLEKEWLDAARQERGRFRQFLLMAFKRFMANEWDAARRLKRGGAQFSIPLDAKLAERLYVEECDPSAAADELYEKRWVLALLDRVLATLRREFSAAGREAAYEYLKPHLTSARGEIAYAGLAAELGSTEGAARVAVHRMRRRYREIFREEIAATVAADADVADELAHLLDVLAR
jgi:DNA-directed RNA polymerase specialized sigma24 family protein